MLKAGKIAIKMLVKNINNEGYKKGGIDIILLKESNFIPPKSKGLEKRIPYFSKYKLPK